MARYEAPYCPDEHSLPTSSPRRFRRHDTTHRMAGRNDVCTYRIQPVLACAGTCLVFVAYRIPNNESPAIASIVHQWAQRGRVLEC